MRHVAVRRTALILATVFVVCAGLFAWLATDREAASADAAASAEGVSPVPAAEAGGAALYETYCAGCHPVETLRAELSAERRRELEAFLGKHGKSSDEEDRLIIDYLAGR
jgi:cytochrome c5